MITIFFRTLIIYILLIGVMKLMGKRQIGELQLSELVTTLLLSELAALPITNNNIPLAYAIIPIVLLLSMEIIISYFVTKSAILKKIFDGMPSILIKKGVLEQEELKKIRLSVEELLGQLRLKNISDIKDVEYAVLEQNGQLSVVPKAQTKSVTAEDMNLQPLEKGIAHPLIIDGHISQYNLTMVGQTKEWLLKQVYNKKCNLKEVFLLTIDDQGNQNFIKKIR